MIVETSRNAAAAVAVVLPAQRSFGPWLSCCCCRFKRSSAFKIVVVVGLQEECALGGLQECALCCVSQVVE